MLMDGEYSIYSFWQFFRRFTPLHIFTVQNTSHQFNAIPVEEFVGCWVGTHVGKGVGLGVGSAVTSGVGSSDGSGVGPNVGSVVVTGEGRGVGYEVIEHVPHENIEEISATKIRDKMREDGKL